MATHTMGLTRPRSFLLVAMVLPVLGAVLPIASNRGAVPAVPGLELATVDADLLGVATGSAQVIIQATSPNATGAAARAVARTGGTVTRALPLIDGLAATVPSVVISTLAAVPGVKAISRDRPMRVQGSGGSTSADSVYTQAVGADAAWQAGVNGAGVAVALIDTGIAPVGDLAGRILPITDDITGASSPCENLSGEVGCGDSYGHGTFIAGIIAGNGAASNGARKGVAPNANLISVKIAGRDGSSDVSNVIAALQWVVSFKGRYGIKVVNLSLGTDGTQTYRTDPLNYAVERAWSSGVVVVVAASNRGPAAGTISKPGDDPWVITVGAVDDQGTAAVRDDQLPNFSSRGPTAADGLAKPDIVAPGAHIVSLRSPGSAIDTLFPSTVDGTYRRGSGTSMATGVVSGTVALMLQANPAMAPDRVKYALTSTARPDASTDPMAVGAGLVNAPDASFSAPAGMANQGISRSNGSGSLNLSRGSVRVLAYSVPRTLVSGFLTAQLLLWNPLLFTSTSWYGSSWYGSSWYGSSWYGSSWYGSSWYGSSWYGSSWYGRPEGSSWYGSSWYGSSWYGAWG